MDCIFCNIVTGVLETNIVYEAQELIAFNDIHPQAPIHVLFIPKKHISTINDLSATDTDMAGKLILAARDYAEKIAVANNGYRLVMNCNQHGGQSVYHLHMHFLAGRCMQWPPG